MATTTRKAGGRRPPANGRPGPVTPKTARARRVRPFGDIDPGDVESEWGPLVNFHAGSHSCLTLIGADFAGWDVHPDVTDDNAVPGQWKAKRAKTSSDLELQVLLRATKAPKLHNSRDGADPPDGTLTITLTNSNADPPAVPVQVPVDYADDTPP